MENENKVETPAVEPKVESAPDVKDDIDKIIDAQEALLDTKGVDAAKTVTSDGKPEDSENDDTLSKLESKDLVKEIKKLRKENGDRRVKVKDLEKKLEGYVRTEEEQREKDKTLEERLVDRDVKIQELSRSNETIQAKLEEFSDFVDEKVGDEISKVPEEYRELIPRDRGPLATLKYLAKANSRKLFEKRDPVVINHSRPNPGDTPRTPDMSAKDKIKQGLRNRKM